MNVECWEDGHAWDAYVRSRSDASNYHRWMWKAVIENTYGHESYYLAATEAGRLCGVLPLFSIQSALFGRSLVSLPFFSYGGVISESPVATSALLAAAARLGAEKKARHIELRQNESLSINWQAASAKVRMEVPLPGTVDAMWKRLSTGLRNKIRKGQKSDLRVEWAGDEGIDAFYVVFAANMRNLGTPVYPKRWFQEMYRATPESIRILNLWSGDRPVAAAFLVAYRDTLELPWSASLPDSRRQYSHVLLYWTFMEWAIQNGFRTMDLGRCTPGGGTYEFKRHWICEEEPMQWYYWVPEGGNLPEIRTDNKKFKLAIEAWKHLPLPIANRLGPHIVRALP